MSAEQSSSRVKVRNVVLDSGPIIKGHALNMHIIAEKIYTIPEVITEIRDSKSRDMLERMPFLEIREPTQDAIKAVCDFARKTGDLAALSVTDLKLCALTYALEAELVGTKHIRTEPTPVKVSVGSQRRKPQEGASTNASTAPSEAGDAAHPADCKHEDADAEVATADADAGQNPENTEENGDQNTEESDGEEVDHSDDGENDDEEGQSGGDDANDEGHEEHAGHAAVTEVAESLEQATISEASTEETKQHEPPVNTTPTGSNVQTTTAQSSGVAVQKQSAAQPAGAVSHSRFISVKGRYAATAGMTEADDDGEGWINPSNVTECVATGRGMLSGQRTSGNRKGRQQRIATVACCTTDFSMQNLLMRMNLQVCAVDGVRVTQVKQWVLRCNGCYTIHFETNRMFCSKCGAHHLFRVSSSIDSRTGELRLHLKKNYQYDTTGMRYNLPKPGKGDRYHGELLLREDQLLYGVWRQKSRQATKALKSSFGEDITADVGLNLKAQAQLQYGLGKKNPNTQKGRERRGKKKRS